MRVIHGSREGAFESLGIAELIASFDQRAFEYFGIETEDVLGL
jgi:hypothetical protein